MTALIELEMQQLETDTTPRIEDYSEVHVSESTELDEKESIEIDLKYGGDNDNDNDDDIDLNDNDKKYLLSFPWVDTFRYGKINQPVTANWIFTENFTQK